MVQGLRRWWSRWSLKVVSCLVSLRNSNITEQLIEGIWRNSAAHVRTRITTLQLFKFDLPVILLTLLHSWLDRCRWTTLMPLSNEALLHE